VSGSTARTIVATAAATAALLAGGYAMIHREPPPPEPRPSVIDAALAEAARTPLPPPAAEPDPPPPPEPEPPPEPATAPSASLEEIVSRATPAVVRVEVSGSIGSGFFIRPDVVLTNVHVVTDHSQVTLRLNDGTTRAARVETAAPELDIAVLRVATANPSQSTLTMKSAAAARPGQEVIVLGTPLGLQNTVTRGIVSALRQVGPLTLVQTDAAINPGNSGGPVLDREGNAIGIATLGVRSAQGLSFAVAIDHAQALLEGRRPSGAAATPLAGLSQAMGGPSTEAAASETEVRRQRGASAFENAVVQAARQADELDGYWTTFRRNCYNGEIAGAFSRDWFALFEPRAMRGAVAPACATQFAELQRVAERVRAWLVDADESARRADVYPGTRRDLLRRHRLEYVAWSR
jgi:S1-C subfamily serine protease